MHCLVHTHTHAHTQIYTHLHTYKHTHIHYKHTHKKKSALFKLINKLLQIFLRFANSEQTVKFLQAPSGNKKNIFSLLVKNKDDNIITSETQQI